MFKSFTNIIYKCHGKNSNVELLKYIKKLNTQFFKFTKNLGNPDWGFPYEVAFNILKFYGILSTPTHASGNDMFVSLLNCDFDMYV